jgi:hypothetical protein
MPSNPVPKFAPSGRQNAPSTPPCRELFDLTTARRKNSFRQNSLEKDDPHSNPLYATRELNAAVRVVSRLSQVL